MQESPEGMHLVRFGPFEVNVSTGELRKHDTRLKVQDQPFQVLVMLLARAGKLVTREEIRAKLWPSGTFVDFDNGLNTAVSRLRETLGDSAESPHYIETFARRGYRWMAPVEWVASGLDDSPPRGLRMTMSPAAEVIIPKASDNDPEHSYQSAGELRVDLERLGLSGGTTRRIAMSSRMWVLGLGAVLSVSLLMGLLWSRFTATRTEIHSLAVLPFATGGDTDSEYLGDGIADNLIDSLSQVPNLAVMSRNSTFRYKDKNLDAQTAGRELKVEAVLTGRILRRNDGLIISVELLDVRKNRHLWGERYNSKLADILDVQEEISREISGKLRLRLSNAEQKRLAKRNTNHPEAYQAYLKARFYWNLRDPQSVKKSVALFHQALDIDPNYALAYAGLGDAYQFVEDPATGWASRDYNKSREAYDKALELDETVAEAHAGLGLLLLECPVTASEWEASERELKRAIELNPSYASAYQWHSNFLAYFGRNREAMAEALRALELDPLSPIINTTLGYRFAEEGKYDEAIAQYRRVLEMTPGLFAAHQALSMAYIQKGLFNESITEDVKVYERVQARPKQQDLDDYEALRQAYQTGGPRGYWQKCLELGLRDFNEAKDKDVQLWGAAVSIASFYARLGQDQQALEWLARIPAARSCDMKEARMDPAFKHLRSNPHFQQAMRQVGLPP